MKCAMTYLMAGGLLCGILVPCAHAQKGMGDRVGVARQVATPDIVSLSGKVLKVEAEPCKMTTGRALVGTHVLLETSNGDELNIHLGPKVEVDQIAEQLTVGTEVLVKAFRTAKMPEQQYVAQSLTIGDRSMQLRDENLRPFWAGKTAASSGPGCPWRGQGYGQGQGRGQGKGPGYGQGQGRGQGQCSRNGQGKGPGYGQGQGRGQGQGPGYGQGQGRGQGQGPRYGQGQGRGQGQGPGYGQGQGRGQGQGPGYGQGRGGAGRP